ncbi:MAG: M28 family metallopeptidase [Gemmatimonadaceae bacterium]
MISIRTACVTLALAAGTVGAQQLPLKRVAKPTRPAITAEDLMSRLYVYADDSMGGRAAGTPYNDKATGIIADWARKIGLTPAGDSGTYFQTVPLARRTWEVTSPVVGGTAFEYQKDFGVFAQWVTKPFDGADVVFGGLLGDTSVHLTAEQTNGKVVVFGFTPDVMAKGLQVQFGMALSRPILGAVAVVLPMLDNAPSGVRAFLMRKESVTAPSAGPARVMPPVLIASDAMAAALVGGPLAQAKWGTAGVRYTGKVALVESATSARNVVATIEGSDPVLKHEYVAIGAHNDHIGTMPTAVDHDSLRAYNGAVEKIKESLPEGKEPTAEQLAGIKVNVDSIRKIRPVRRDSIANGADDDGSGTVTVAEIAEAFAASKVKPKRSLLFVWHTGEELGLVGSDWFTRHPTVPLDSVVTQLNLDMVGRGAASDIKGGGPGYLGLVGSRRLSTELGDLVESVNKEQKAPFTFDYTFDANGHPENIYCRSDHANYARFGIPVTFFSTGLHRDYHQVTDESEYIDYPHMAAIGQLVYDVALRVANADHRMLVDKQKPSSPFAACKQ